MPEQPSLKRIETMYDEQAVNYAGFKEGSFSWRFIERPAFDRYLSDTYIPGLTNLYRPDTVVLDIGCGAGLVVQHLVSHGIRPNNITGIDLSKGLLDEARNRLPEAHFIQASADSFSLPPESYDLVTSNMVFHYMDNEQLTRTFELIYEALKPDGTLFFVDADPDYTEETSRPENVNKWLELPTPWGGTAPWFSRSPHELLLDISYYTGFDIVAGFPLPVIEEGREYPEEYAKYTSYPARIAARLTKVSEEEKQWRLTNLGKPVPLLV